MSKTKKKLLIILCIIVVMVVLFFPFKHEVLEDGNSDVYTALTYKSINWCHISTTKCGGKIYFDKKIYFFPNNMKSNDELKEDYLNEN